MTENIEQRLGALGITLPEPAAPVANYIPAIIDGQQLYISGQLPLKGGTLAFAGILGNNLNVDEGQAAARLCAINILAQAKAVLGDLERITRCLRLGGFVSATPDFQDHPAVINGASDLMVAVLGDKGKHTRFAIGTASLPLGAAVEIDALFAIA